MIIIHSINADVGSNAVVGSVLACQFRIYPYKKGSNLRFINNIQLSPEGEVNGAGYIYRDGKRRGIYLAL